MNQPTHTDTSGATPSPYRELRTDAVEHRRVLARDLTPAAEVKQRARLAEEARLLEGLAHPGVPRVIEVDLESRDDAERPPSVTLRLLPGVHLSDILAALHGDRATPRTGIAGGEPWSFTGALKVVVRLVETVAFAHDHDVIHRGIEPRRVVSGRFGEVQLNAWHLARDLGREDRHDLHLEAGVLDGPAAGPAETLLTVDGDDLGAAPYVAPELLRGEQYHVGKAADVYSLGAILYHLLSGRAPHIRPGEEEVSVREFARRATAGPPPAVRGSTSRAPHALTRVVERALSPRRHRRPADARELLREIEAAVAHGFTRTGPAAGLALWAREHRIAAALLLLGAGVLFLRAFRDEDVPRAREVIAANGSGELERRASADEPAREQERSEKGAATAQDPFIREPARSHAEPAAAATEGVLPPHVGDAADRTDVPTEPPVAAAPDETPDAASVQVLVDGLFDALVGAFVKAFGDGAKEAPLAPPLEAPAEESDPTPDERPADAVDGPADAAAVLEPPNPAMSAAVPKLLDAPDPHDALERRAVEARAEEDWAAAARGFDELYHERVAALGEGHALTLRARRELAACLVEGGEAEAALIHLHGCLALHTERDALALELEREYADVLLTLGERAAGEQRLEQAAALAKELHGPGSAIVAKLYDQVASSAFRFGELDRVAKAFECGLAARLAAASALQPSEQTDVLAQRSTLVSIYQRLERPAAALQHARALLAATPEEHSAHAARAALVASLETKVADE